MRRLVPILLLSSAAACTSNDGESIILLKNVAPGDGCSFASNASELFVSHGKLDLSFGNAYLFTAQLKSRIVVNADPTDTTTTGGDVDQKTIFANAANIDLTFPNSKVDLSGLPTELVHFKKLFSAVILPDGGITDASFELIPADTVAAILAINANPPNIETLATITVIGDLSGSEVKSQEFQYPVTLGMGLTARDLKMPCPLPAMTVVQAGNSCNPAQDGVVDCCDDGATLVCPATVSQ